jgi:Fe-S cluster assembly protein SufD
MVVAIDKSFFEKLNKEFAQNNSEQIEKPTFLKEKSESAFARFKELGFPTNELEDWKYINLQEIAKTLTSKSFHAQNIKADIEQIIAENRLEGLEHNFIVLENGNINYKYSKVKDNIFFSSISEALKEHSELINNTFDKIDDDSFAHLNTSFLSEGLFLYVPAETLSKEPIHVISITNTNEENSFVSQPRNLFILGKRAKAKIVYTSTGQANSQYFSNLVNEIILEENSSLRFGFIQDESHSAIQTAYTSIKQNKGSELTFNNFTLGAHISRHKIHVDLLEEASSCNLNGLYVLADNNQAHNQLVLNHHKPNCKSSQLYKGILDDEAKAEFTGIINVAKQAIGTDAKQLNRNLLLSSKAKVDTRPQLQIEADDVKCSHGATIGQLEDEQLFYLLSRGIDKNQAKKVLTYGFAEEIIQKISIPSLRKRLDNLFLANVHNS